jgi:serine/threonine protein kinase
MLDIGARLGPYEIVSFLGAGGMGRVYRARDWRLEREVAIKVLPDELAADPVALSRFEREAKAVAALSHPNIVAIYDFGSSDGQAYAVTELLEGGTLRTYLESGRMSWRKSCEIAAAVAAGLAAAHAKGVVHRDIKPENVFIASDGRVKVLDFGLAHTAAPPVPGGEDTGGPKTAPGTILGSIGYMSPEQVRSEKADAGSDIFSLGCVLYEMLTGRRPFQRATPVETIAALLGAEPAPPPSAAGASIPYQLDQLVLHCLARDPARRFQSARDLGFTLQAIAHGGAAEQLPPSRRDGGQGATTEARNPSSPSFREAPSRASSPDFAVPETRYARSGDVNIAYQVVGSGAIDLVFVMGWITHLEYFWREPSFARFLRRLASFSRLILFDKRGTGLSDRVPLDQLPTLEQRMDDVRAVMEAVGSHRAALCGISEGGPLCGLFAATYPDRTAALVMIGTYAKRLWAPDYPWAPTVEARQRFLEVMQREWGGPVGLAERAPTRADHPGFRDWWATYLRMGASPGAAVALTRMNSEVDIRHILPTIRVPALILHRSGDLCLKVEEGRFVAAQIPGARYVELPGSDHLPFVGDQDAILDEMEEFLTGVRHVAEPDRLLATVLYVRAPAVDRGAGLTASRATLERELEWFRGRPIELTGEHLIAAFDGPARAVRCGSAVLAGMQRSGVAVSAGLHTGECDVVGDSLGGVPVELAAAVAQRAAAGEILVSSTVRDLVAGSGIAFAGHDSVVVEPHGEWRLFRVTT